MRLPLRDWKSTLESLGFSPEHTSNTPRTRRKKHSQRRFSLEPLEKRAMLTTNWLVTTLSDAPTHTGLSLRDAIADAAASTGDDLITFDSSLFNGQLQQINLTSGFTIGSTSSPVLGNIASI